MFGNIALFQRKMLFSICSLSTELKKMFGATEYSGHLQITDQSLNSRLLFVINL